MTLRQMASIPSDVPATVAWALADLEEARGKQELFTRQSPQRLKALRDHALVESAVSSNRIEGVTIAQARVVPVRERPKQRPLVCFDERLRTAAAALGFSVRP